MFQRVGIPVETGRFVACWITLNYKAVIRVPSDGGMSPITRDQIVRAASQQAVPVQSQNMAFFALEVESWEEVANPPLGDFEDEEEEEFEEEEEEFDCDDEGEAIPSGIVDSESIEGSGKD